MMKTPRRLALWGFLLAMASGRGVGSPPGPAVQPVGDPGSTSGFTFRLDIPALSLAETPDGRAAVQLEGFGPLRAGPGFPDLPSRTFLVAIPPGVEPRLSVRVLAEDELRGIRPQPLGKEIAEVHSDPLAPAEAKDAIFRNVTRRERRDENPDIYEGRAPYPSEPVRLGKIGILRDQRYVEVVATPVRYDPRLPGLRVARSLEVAVAFEGDDLARTAPATDPRFESVYRDAFVNYAQGKTFRLGPLARERGKAAARPEPEARDSGPSLFGRSGGEARASGSSSSGPRYKIRIRENRVVRLDSTRMTGTGFLSEPLSTWKLASRGVEVPLRVHDANGNDLMDPGDWVQFYGQALDDEPETVLNTDLAGTDADIYEARDFSDENVYFLTVESGPRSRMPVRDSTPTNTRTPPADFEAIAHREVENAWRPLGPADPWYWSPTQSNPASGGLVPSRTESVSLPGLASGTSPARVIVKLRGITEDSSTNPDHKSRVTLKNSSGQSLQSNDDNGTFDGRTLYTHDFTWSYPGSGPVLTDPAQVTIEALSVPGAPASYKNQFILDFIEIRYRRLFKASDDGLTFDWPDGDAEFEVSGLSSSNPEIYEITGRVGGTGIVDVVRLTGATVTGAGPFTVRFRVDDDPALPDGTLRRFVIAGSGAVAIPPDPDFQSDTVSDLRNTTNQADLIVIAHPAVLDQSPGSPLEQLLSLRASQGITSKVARLEDVEDEFNFGLSGPLAIKNFLEWVMSTNPGEGWADPKPSFVLLLGDGSYDYKGGTAQGNFTPTQILFLDRPELGYYASDNLLADVVGDDQLADLAIGRIPGRSAGEVNTVLQKIVDYEQVPPAGNWRRHALFVSDRGKNYNPAEALSFESTNDLGESYMKRPPHTSRKLRYWTDYCGGVASGCTPTETEAIRQDIKDAINGVDGVSDGASIAQYEGHGNFDVWSDDAFFDNRDPAQDPEDLNNGVRLPWLLAHDCLSGGFHTTAVRSMGENWTKRVGGGAVAVFSPTGLSFSFMGSTVTDVVWNDLFGPKKERELHVPVVDTLVRLCGQGSTEACQHYELLGDPATRLIFPSVGPPQNVTATCGNARVDLVWTASSTPGATYDVYRSPDLVHGTYSKINASPVPCCSYADTSVVNADDYYYYVVALDSEGFESRWSNFNSDCDLETNSCDSTPADDCVKATPLNPNPPAPPTGVVVTDPETGGKLNVTWNPNSESDLKYYTVHWGTSPGVYTNSENTGKNTSHTITGLSNGTTYYIAVTATNTSNKTSGYSEEKTGVPTLVQGVKSPGFVSDLRLDKSGSDIVLTWSAVTKDIYGKAETVARYEIFRGTTPTFTPDLSNKIGETTATSFTDPGALGAGLPSYDYLVRAVDVDGNAGGLGRQLPDGVSDLRVDKSSTTPGNVVLSWSAVTDTFDPSGTGKKTIVDHYEIYAKATPFARSEICDLAEAGCSGLSPILSTTSTSVELTPPSSNQFYSVIVVDNRGNKSPF